MMDTLTDQVSTPAVRRLGPEDLQRGQYVTVMQRTGQSLNYHLFCESPEHPSVTVERYAYLPKQAGQPLKVLALCIPFVLVKTARGKCHMLDLRRVDLALLSDDFGRAAFKALKSKKKSGD